MAVEPSRAKAIFLEAANKASRPSRTAFLEQACAGDEELRRRVQALLQAHDAAFSVLDRPAGEQFPSLAGRANDASRLVDPQAPSAEDFDTHLTMTARPGAEVLALLEPPRREGSLG